MSNEEKAKSIQDSIIPVPDTLFDVGLFKDPKIAKRVLAQVATDVFNPLGDRTEAMKNFDEFISGRVELKFDETAKAWGMIPNISKGITYWVIPIEKTLSTAEKVERSKELSKELLTIGADTSIRSLTRFFLLSSEFKREEYIRLAEDE